MNKLSIFTLKALRKLYAKAFNVNPQPKPECEQDPDKASQIIYDALMDDKPFMIARFGSTELTCFCNYIGIKQQKNKIFGYIKGKTNHWWWEPKIMNQMQQWSGFFPPTIEKLEQFCELMIQDIPEVDVLGSWLANETDFERQLGSHKKINLELLNPYFSKEPWTRALSGKKVLVVHPFASTIETQYKKRKLLFKDDLLPEFELQTVKAVQSLAGEKTPFTDWFEALEWMKAEIDKQDYDICLIGAGAYGFLLAAHIKRMGKKAVHLGGSLQLLFGIRGKRWENENYNPTYNYARLINEYWVRPGDDEKPQAKKLEGDGCYW